MTEMTDKEYIAHLKKKLDAAERRLAKTTSTSSSKAARQMAVLVVEEMLTRLGIDHADPKEVQKDMLHLRESRQACETVKKRGTLVLISIFFTGLATILALGFKEFVRSLH